MLNLLSVGILLFQLTLTSKLEQRAVFDKKTGIYMGIQDEITGLDTRIVNDYASNPVSLTTGTYGIIDLGISEWGPLQVSLLMKEFPEGYEKTNRQPFCRISEESITTYIRSQIERDSSGSILDKVISGDKIFYLTNRHELNMLGIKPQFIFVNAMNNIEISKLESKLEVIKEFPNFPKTFHNHFGAHSVDKVKIAYHNATETLYMATVFEAASFDLKTEKFTKIKHAEHLKSDILNVFIRDDVLFIGRKLEGIELFNIKDAKKVTYIGTIGHSEFGVSSENFELRDFDVDDYQLEIIDGENSQDFLNTSPDAKVFFKNNFTYNQRNDFYKAKRFEENYMFVATIQGVHVFDITGLLKNLRLSSGAGHIPHVIQKEGIKQIQRFHNTLYMLTEVNGYAQILEVFLYGKSLKAWTQKKADPSYYAMNTMWSTNEGIDFIYVDQMYLYFATQGNVYMNERGVPRELETDISDYVRWFEVKDVHSLSKAIINGFDFLIAISSDRITEIEVSVSDPHLRCPSKSNHPTQAYGKYVFELNATLKTCPVKAQELGALEASEYFKSPCLYKTMFEINYSKNPFYKESSHLAVISVIIIVICVILIICIFLGRRRVNELNIEQEKLRQEITHYKDKGFAAAQIKDSNKYKLNKSEDSINKGNKSDEGIPQGAMEVSRQETEGI